MGSKLAAIVPDQLFGCQPASPLNKSAFNLADINRWVQRPSGIMQNVSSQNPVFTGQTVNGDLANRRAIGKIIKGAALTATLSQWIFGVA